ncbi:hypothetical protein D3C78_1579890 [compost metagenome]
MQGCPQTNTNGFDAFDAIDEIVTVKHPKQIEKTKNCPSLTASVAASYLTRKIRTSQKPASTNAPTDCSCCCSLVSSPTAC